MYEVEGYDDLGYAEALAMYARAGYLVGGVVAAVVEGEGEGYLVFVLIEHGDRVHAARKYYDAVFHLAWVCLRSSFICSLPNLLIASA